MSQNDISVNIREATIADLAEASRLVAAVFNQTVSPLLEAEGKRVFLEYAALDAWISRHENGQRTWLALDDQKLLGVLHMRDDHVSLFFVDRERQRMGIGRSLIKTAIKALGVDRLTVNSSPNSVEAYRRIGFEPLGPEETKSGIRYTPMAARFEALPLD